VSDLPITRGAKISACGAFRSQLWRRTAQHGAMIFIMLNPSTADAERDDPTIRRCMAFARREGLGSVHVVNLFTHRSPSPRSLWAGSDPAGPDALYAIRDAITLADPEKHTVEMRKEIGHEIPFDRIVCAWGALPSGAPDWFRIMHKDHVSEVIGYAGDMGRTLWCLGRTASGAPRHPLYVRNDQPLERWPA
jgi:hypothetical protein